MPDRQILEAMIESKLKEIVEQNDGFTPLEQELRTIVVYHIRGLSSWETQLRMLKDVKSCSDRYLALLQTCVEATPRKQNDKSVGYYNDVQKHHGYNVTENELSDSDNAIIEGRLAELEIVGLVTGWRFSYVVHTTQQIYENGEFIAYPKQKNSDKHYKSFIATERGIKLLEEHRRIKSGKGEHDEE